MMVGTSKSKGDDEQLPIVRLRPEVNPVWWGWLKTSVGAISSSTTAHHSCKCNYLPEDAIRGGTTSIGPSSQRLDVSSRAT
jgi:hypothetical protein